MKTQYFETYQAKLKLEAAVKSALCGISCGFIASLILACVFWFTSVEALWWLAVALVVAAIPASFAFYFLRFRPTDLSNARRLDSLGLEERMITMVEFDREDSYMAKAQRADAKAALATVNKGELKLKISRGIWLALAICGVLSAGMTTVNILSKYEILPNFEEILEEQMTVYVTLSYEVDEGGYIEGGDEIQIIPVGTDGTTVTAVADEGYQFQEWSDGYQNPTRTDYGVTEDVTYFAIFVELGDEEGDEGDGDGEGGNSDQAGDQPGEDDGSGEGNSEAPSEPSDEPNPGSGGKAQPNNQVINGQTFYREVIEYYQDLADEQIESGDHGLSDEEIELIKKYLGIV